MSLSLRGRALIATTLGLALAGPMRVALPADAAVDDPAAAPSPSGAGRIDASDSTLSRPQVARLLEKDSTMRLDSRGALYVVDPVRTPPRDLATATTRTESLTRSSSSLLYPTGDTFSLHSRPGATKTIFLDVDGTTLGETAWTLAKTGSSQPAWDPAGDGASFSAGELAKVQEVWASVAADYEAFDVDVTTEDPGTAGLVRSDADDTAYGIHVVIGASSAWGPLCSSSCGGVAYVGTYAEIGGSHQPAWVFTQGTGNSAKSVAEAASHEVGHTLGLTHDGTRSAGYYSGSGLWAPIMGVGYYRPVSQWSRGSYPGANNRQDDVLLLSRMLGYRDDEAGVSFADTSLLPDDHVGTITSYRDRDAFALGACDVGSTVTVSPATWASDLDIVITVRTTKGVRLGSSYTVTTTGDGVTAAGLAAAYTIPAPASGKPPWGDLVVEISGRGQNSYSSGGYDAYGSLGSYVVDAPGCNLEPLMPGAMNDVTATVLYADAATVAWTPPTDGDLAPTAYKISVNGASWRTASVRATSMVVGGLKPLSTNSIRVRAVNGLVPGPTETVSVTMPALTVPGVPASFAATPGTGQLALTWSKPDDTGNAPILGYKLTTGSKVYAPSAASVGALLRFLTAGTEYTLTLQARNKAGYGPALTITGTPTS
ncbi:fibronectin type III domain-containing protein [Nocardioides sp. GY 10127]|uniref:fibronectin type III domain-containing protein n=1 Tax=Nocardioides sp. GY 10127 TaxID=2569762 RepID=UPI00145868D4|nr:fibronectin type III domain-containing protein [Nocardioides sp. GY 10127]